MCVCVCVYTHCIRIHIYNCVYNDKTHNVLKCKTEKQDATLQHFKVCLKKHHNFLQGLQVLKLQQSENHHLGPFPQAVPEDTVRVTAATTKRELRPFTEPSAHCSVRGKWGLPSGLQWAQSNHNIMTLPWTPRHSRSV